MSVAEDLIKKAQETKSKTFFDTKQKVSALTRAPLSFDKRKDGWLDVFGTKNPQTGKKETTDDFWIERSRTNPNALFLCFSNGLRITDADQNVSFGAYANKGLIDQEKAIQAVRMAANHLCRRGDRLEVGSNYSGSAPYMKAFEDATKEARTMITKEQLANLTTSR